VSTPPEPLFPVKQVMPQLSQPKPGYRYSTDAVVLAAFAAQRPTSVWADLGTGCGVLAVRILRSWPQSRGLAIESSTIAHEHAAKNLDKERVTLVKGDLRGFSWKKNCFDLVVSNPPFYDHHAFRKNLDPQVRQARHALLGDIVEFSRTLKPALKRNGRFCFVFPADLVEKKLEALGALGFYPQRKLEFRSFHGDPPHRVCLELGLEETALECTGMTLYDAPGYYNRETWEFLTSANAG